MTPQKKLNGVCILVDFRKANKGTKLEDANIPTQRYTEKPPLTSMEEFQIGLIDHLIHSEKKFERYRSTNFKTLLDKYEFLPKVLAYTLKYAKINMQMVQFYNFSIFKRPFSKQRMPVIFQYELYYYKKKYHTIYWSFMLHALQRLLQLIIQPPRTFSPIKIP